MKVNIFGIYDSGVQCFMQPFFSMTKESAIRSVKDTMQSNDSMMGKHAEDFSLFHLGEFNDSDGVITPMLPPVHICTVLSLKQVDMFDKGR